MHCFDNFFSSWGVQSDSAQKLTKKKTLAILDMPIWLVFWPFRPGLNDLSLVHSQIILGCSVFALGTHLNVFFSSSKELHTTNRCTHISSIQILCTSTTITSINAHALWTHKFFTQAQRALYIPQGICNTIHHEIRWRDQGL
jgi:hypothetical protein